MIKTIKSWIINYAKQNGKTSLIIPRNNSNSTFLNNICTEITSLKTYSFFGEATIDEIINKAEEINGLILSEIDRTDSNLIRHYHKYKEGNADIFPLLDLYKTEIFKDGASKKILDMSIEDIEWADKENEQYKIIENDELPQNTQNWFRYTLSQKQIIARIHQIEKLTRHKIITRPYLKFK